jgi:pyruvate carboxylase
MASWCGHSPFDSASTAAFSPRKDLVNYRAHPTHWLICAQVDVKVAVGDAVSAGDPMVVLSAMKMETVCAASVDGVVSGVSVAMGDALQPGDLLVTIKESNNNEADAEPEALAA